MRPTFLEAALAAREAEPDHIPFVIRIGHDAVLADRSKARLRCYYCIVECMGQIVPVQVVENVGKELGSKHQRETTWLDVCPPPIN